MGTQLNSTQRKIHHLLSSGAVTVTGPNQPRALKTKTLGNSIVTNNVPQQNILGGGSHCFVCDEIIAAHQVQHQLVEMQTSHTTTKFPKKIGQLVGDCFMIIVSAEDVICARCTNLINYYDRLENDIERVRTNLVGLLNKKYGLSDEGGGSTSSSPPLKMQKLNSGIASRTVDDNDANRIRKIVPTAQHPTATTTADSNIAKQAPAVSVVQQLKIPQTAAPVVPQPAAGAASTQTLQRKITKIYKCLCCEYKTNDMRLFNTHYETCKQQSFQCKNCKKIYGNFGLMKQHMIREHNTPMENTCSVCHINLVNDASLRKHMETMHATSVVVTSTTTIPTSSLAATDPGVNEQLNVPSPIVPPMNTSLYSCNQCQFKSTDKVIFDDHLRKHLGKPKPFKCRLCSQRFETKEGATAHLKQHQQPPSIFKCGTCSVTFNRRELLSKHIEMVHQPQHQQHDNATPQLQITAQTPQSKQQLQQQHVQGQTIVTTQKLLQDTINEALSENIGSSGVNNDVTDVTSGANNIRFYSCQNCSLTFVNENYYNQHMDTHRRDKKDSSNNSTPITSQSSTIRRNSSINQVGGLMNDGLNAVSSTKENNMNSVSQANNGQGMQEVDIESIFEKIHSDKGDNNADLTNASSTTGSNGENVVIASQDGTAGGITFNISIPQTNVPDQQKNQNANNAGVSIDMPMLDPSEEDVKNDKGIHDKQKLSNDIKNKSAAGSASSGPPVSMPSLDDDSDANVMQQQHQQQQHQQQQSQQKDGASNPDGNLSNNVDSVKVEVKSEEGKEEASSSKGEQQQHHEQVTLSSEETAAAALLEQHQQQHPSQRHVTDSSSSTIGEQQAHSGNSVEGQAETPDQLAAAAAASAAEGGAAGGNPATASTEGGEASANANAEGQVAIELDEAMQAQVDSGQIKFILNENGQLLQLDNHILTDADGNQILVQDPEQIQQLLQTVGVLQGGDGIDSETLQVVTDGNGQMVLVQGENNETQLIDASLLNAEGQLVIQPGQEGELGEGAHVISEDGTRIPVSVSYTADGQPIVQVQHQVLEAAQAEGQQIVIEGKDAAEAAANAAVTAETGGVVDGVPQTVEGSSTVTTTVTTTATSASTISSGGGFLSFEDLIQQQQQQQNQQQQQQASETKTAE